MSIHSEPIPREGKPGRSAQGGPASLPNVLTYGRIVAVPAILLCLYLEQPGARWAALALIDL